METIFFILTYIAGLIISILYIKYKMKEGELSIADLLWAILIFIVSPLLVFLICALLLLMGVEYLSEIKIWKKSK